MYSIFIQSVHFTCGAHVLNYAHSVTDRWAHPIADRQCERSCGSDHAKAVDRPMWLIAGHIPSLIVTYPQEES